MNDEMNKVDATVEGNEKDYIDTIQELRDNTVEKTKYDALRAENAKLIKALANGERLEGTAQPVQKPSAEALKKELCEMARQGARNVDMVSKYMELRQVLLDETGIDYFVPMGSQYNTTAEDVAAAKRVADAYESILEASQGNNDIFTATLMSRTAETPLVAGNLRNRN